MSLPTVGAAARNNAEWCQAVCRVNGCPGTFAADAWTTTRRAPPYYPDAVTLEPGIGPRALLDRVDATAGCSVKDSFATLDLAPLGFRVLFEAQWVGRAHRSASARGPSGWRPIGSARDFAEWEAAWAASEGAASPFRPALLDDPNVVVLGDRRGGHVLAGAVLNRGGGVVGLSNLFAVEGDLDAAWDGAVDAATARFPDDAIVGYESGAALAVAHHHGFVSLGALRVWVEDGESQRAAATMSSTTP